MFLIDRGKYYQDEEVIYSAVYGRGFYQWNGRMVQDPLGGDDGRGNVSPLLENIETGELFFMKWLDETSDVLPEYIKRIKNPPNRDDILWPCDLVRFYNEIPAECSLAVDQVYNYSHERQAESHKLAVLFPYGGYPVCEDGYRYLSHIGVQSWRNEKIRAMAVQIAKHIKNVNDKDYLYLDFHLSRMFFQEDGELFLNFSNLALPFSQMGRFCGKETREVSYSYHPETYTYPVEFAEPAIIQGIQNTFDYRSQNYSLAAMLFFLFFGRYAYDGRLMDGYMDDTEREHYEKFRDYHKMPVFIFDRQDTSNALGTFADEQQILDIWNEAPAQLRDMFSASLCQKNAQREVKEDMNFTPSQWLECFTHLGWYQEEKLEKGI